MNFANKIRGLKEIWQFDNHWYLAFSRFVFPHQTALVYRFKGLEILTDHSAGDANGAREILTTEMYRQYIPKMDLANELNILDLGANNGGFPILLRSEGLIAKKLVCVELNPTTFSRLQFNIERNFGPEATVINAAVAGKNGEIEVSLGGGSVGDSIYQNGNAGSAISIDCVTFDSLFESTFGDETVDLCKIDIEGAEYEVFSTGHDTCLRNCRNILMEIHHSAERPREIIRNRLHGLNFIEIDPALKSGAEHYVHFFVNQTFS